MKWFEVWRVKVLVSSSSGVFELATFRIMVRCQENATDSALMSKRCSLRLPGKHNVYDCTNYPYGM
jgi:hypothetical protein